MEVVALMSYRIHTQREQFYDLGKTQSWNVIPQGPGNMQKIAEKTVETQTRPLVFL